jgi:uncharacterized membrane protein
MKTRFNNLWGKVTASYWFVPALMCIAAMTGASLALRSGRGASVLSNHGWLAWASVNTADGARELLSTIASSTITVAGVIFSITVLALSFASSQYGPRLLRNFMRDRLSQVVLGAFLSTYLYCLLVLRTLGAEAETLKLPRTSSCQPGCCQTNPPSMVPPNLWMLLLILHSFSSSHDQLADLLSPAAVPFLVAVKLAIGFE